MAVYQDPGPLTAPPSAGNANSRHDVRDEH